MHFLRKDIVDLDHLYLLPEESLSTFRAACEKLGLSFRPIGPMEAALHQAAGYEIVNLTPELMKEMSNEKAKSS